MSYRKWTEESSPYRHLEQHTVPELLQWMNDEDRKVAEAVHACLPVIAAFVECAVPKMKEGARLFYIGAGTSGRLGVVDASECPPTFGVPQEWVQGIIAGGDGAIRKAVEYAEDSGTQAWKDLQAYYIQAQDLVVGIAASGSTPYVVEGLRHCRENGIATACITSNPGSPVTQHADYAIEVLTGPEFITGSTRLKSGTAQKMILNMISTTIMIGLGRIRDNKMVDMQLTNHKLIRRGVNMILQETTLTPEEAEHWLLKEGSVRAVLNQAAGQGWLRSSGI
ncbi:MAG TPA: N-acetylmuramic acid 6-phosphate etherase [Saprospiraceae bacterium]|nr:N-acetylmuramic acid 6-phosphate etherase [Saprospiraceae bacterium]